MEMLKSIFNYVEKCVINKYNWKFIPNSHYQCIYVDIHKYKGNKVLLSDGTVISKGDIVAEIHVNNKKMKGIKIRQIVEILISELTNISNAMEYNKDYINVKAVYGRTVLFPIAKKVGFEVIDINKKILKYFLYVWDNIIKRVFSTSSKETFTIKEPKEVWISKQALIEKMGVN